MVTISSVHAEGPVIPHIPTPSPTTAGAHRAAPSRLGST